MLTLETKSKEKNIYTIHKMQQCKEAGYICDLCNFESMCRVSKWECECCGKFTNYKGALTKVFRS